MFVYQLKLLLYIFAVTAYGSVFSNYYDAGKDYETSVELNNYISIRLGCLAAVQNQIVNIFQPHLGNYAYIGYADPATHGNLGEDKQI